MGKIFCIMGKSATGKDTIYKRLLADGALKLNKIVTYTTRPIREGERAGEELGLVGVGVLDGETVVGANVPCHVEEGLHA